jgi:hypothetical protein
MTWASTFFKSLLPHETFGRTWKTGSFHLTGALEN